METPEEQAKSLPLGRMGIPSLIDPTQNPAEHEGISRSRGTSAGERDWEKTKATLTGRQEIRSWSRFVKIHISR